MRTMLTLDNDVSLLLEQRQAESGSSFKELVNALLRSAFTRSEQNCGTAARAKIHTPVHHGGTILVGDVTSTAELLAIAEGEDFRFF